MFHQQFISSLSSVRANVACTAQSIRFYSVQASSNEQPDSKTTIDGDENDKLYKRLELEIRGHDPAVMNSYVKFTTIAAQHLNIDVGKRYIKPFEFT